MEQDYYYIAPDGLRLGEIWDELVYVCPKCEHATRHDFASVKRNGWWYCKYCYTNQRRGKAVRLSGNPWAIVRARADRRAGDILGRLQ